MLGQLCSPTEYNQHELIHIHPDTFTGWAASTWRAA
jgi:hypothetical protein